MMHNKWARMPIKSIYLALYDGPHATPKPADEGPVFLGIKNITNDGMLDLSEIRHISGKDFPKWTKRITPQPDDIVFTYEATLNRYALIPEGFRGCLGRRVALIRPDPAKVDARFLLYYFFGEEWRATVAQNMIFGSTVDRIPLVNFPNFEVTVPPLPTQRKIAAILSAYDDLIENNTRRIALLEQTAQLLYREWFVHFRFPGHESVPLVESELGPISEGWVAKSLGEICHLIVGQSPKSEFYNEDGEGLPFHQGVKDFGDLYPTTRVYCTVTKRVAETGDILFSVRAPVGRMNIADRKIVIGRGLHAIRSKTGNQTYILLQLKDKFHEEDMMGGGTIFKSVTKADVLGIQLLMPPDNLLTKFEQIATPMLSETKVLTDKNTNLRRTRDLLLPRLISGQLDVSELEILTGEFGQ